MPSRILLGFLLIQLLVAGALTAQDGDPHDIPNNLILENPGSTLEDESLEDLILELLTPDQLRDYLNGTPPQQITLSNGSTLEAILQRKAPTGFDIPWYSVDGGGGMMSTGGGFELGGTIGQSDAGTMSAANFQLTGGFWAAAAANLSVVIPTRVPAFFPTTVTVPIHFDSGGLEISATTFSVAYDQSCLGFDPSDADFDGHLDNVSFSLPPDFTASVTFSGGEFEIAIVDTIAPLATLPDDEIATLIFTTLCEPTGSSLLAEVSFSSSPAPSFGDTSGQDAPGSGINGSVEILPGFPGDCNTDGILTAGDLSACVLEVFDDDGDSWLAALGGTFPGSPVGCDANRDALINAGDLSCKILMIFEGPDACSSEKTQHTGWTEPVLYMNPEPAAPSSGFRISTLAVPIYFQPRGWAINSLMFSVDYDEQSFAFDPTDSNADGLPDAIQLDLPPSVQATAIFDPTDKDGEIDISIFDPNNALDPGHEPLLSIDLQRRLVLYKAGGNEVGFSSRPGASFGDLSGRSVPGRTVDNPSK